MKNIFRGIGLIGGVFIVFMFFLIADKFYYDQNITINTFELNDYIKGKDLEAIASEKNITIRLVEFKNTSFGEAELNIILLNPDKKLKMGKQKSIFPKQKIVFYPLSDKHLKIKAFSILSEDMIGMQAFKRTLELKGFKVTYDTTESVPLSTGLVFSNLGMSFFMYFILIMFFTITMYFVHRIKEIGVLKLCGVKPKRITFNLMNAIFLNVILGELIIFSIIFMYVLLTDISQILLFISVVLLSNIVLIATILIASLLGLLYISHVSYIGALKNNKHHKTLFILLLLFKVVIVSLLFSTVNTEIHAVYAFKNAINTIENIEKLDLYTINTFTIPKKTTQEKINKYLSTIKESDIYNYNSSMFDIMTTPNNKTTLKLSSLNMITLSPNLLKFYNLMSIDGAIVNEGMLDLDNDILLVPEMYKGNIEIICRSYGFKTLPEIIYIENKQKRDDLLYPYKNIEHSIYRIKKLQKTLYINAGEVLISKQGIIGIETLLKELKIDANTIRINALNNHYRLIKGSLSVKVWHKLIIIITNSLAYILSILAISSIYFEMRKQVFATYNLLGRYPRKTINIFLIINALITTLLAVIINPYFMILSIIEVFVFLFMVKAFINKKTILVLKGE